MNKCIVSDELALASFEKKTLFQKKDTIFGQRHYFEEKDSMLLKFKSEFIGHSTSDHTTEYDPFIKRQLASRN